jgi:hypothetical protein
MQMTPLETLDDTLLTGVLNAGGWSDAADDNGALEHLPASFAGDIVREHASRRDAPSPKALAGLGILALTLSVAEWGVAWEGAPPTDPAERKWQGPTSIQHGKHLMSYALGGIGLPHLDVGGAEQFFKALRDRVPQAKQDVQQFTSGFRYDVVRAKGGVCAPNPHTAVSMVDLNGEEFKHGEPTFGGPHYCDQFNRARFEDFAAWRKLRHWCRVGLRRRDMQAWIIRDWINSFWVPAYNEVMRHPHGTVSEAFVLARIWNTSHGSALNALSKAGVEANPEKRIAAELSAYAAESPTHKQRVGVMQRPGAVYRFLAGAQ